VSLKIWQEAEEKSPEAVLAWKFQNDKATEAKTQRRNRQVAPCIVKRMIAKTFHGSGTENQLTKPKARSPDGPLMLEV
jgi:hypothetical protein